MFNLDKPYSEEVKAFGIYWCAPEEYKMWEKTLVAKIPKIKDSDGQSVEVYCTAAPARFYELKVLSEPDSVGDQQEGCIVSFGSGQWDLAKKIAVAFSEGMIGFKKLDE